ncbi:MAG: hypothetical protein COU30_03235, partial [Candidatus Magasanikbacteria bacterium CG10_big_fil_rev_8_21_14_0_10_38_6]
MQILPEQLITLKTAIGFGLFSCILSAIWAPLLTKILYHFQIVRKSEYDVTLEGNRKSKEGTPIMGGLLVIVTVAVLTVLFNWNRAFTWVPISVMLIAAILGGVDDIMHVHGHKRRSKKLKQVLRLIHVHKDWKQRVWLTITLPWSIFKRTALW